MATGFDVDKLLVQLSCDSVIDIDPNQFEELIDPGKNKYLDEYQECLLRLQNWSLQNENEGDEFADVDEWLERPAMIKKWWWAQNFKNQYFWYNRVRHELLTQRKVLLYLSRKNRGLRYADESYTIADDYKIFTEFSPFYLKHQQRWIVVPFKVDYTSPPPKISIAYLDRPMEDDYEFSPEWKVEPNTKYYRVFGKKATRKLYRRPRDLFYVHPDEQGMNVVPTKDILFVTTPKWTCEYAAHPHAYIGDDSDSGSQPEIKKPRRVIFKDDNYVQRMMRSTARSIAIDMALPNFDEPDDLQDIEEISHEDLNFKNPPNLDGTVNTTLSGTYGMSTDEALEARKRKRLKKLYQMHKNKDSLENKIKSVTTQLKGKFENYNIVFREAQRLEREYKNLRKYLFDLNQELQVKKSEMKIAVVEKKTQVPDSLPELKKMRMDAATLYQCHICGKSLCSKQSLDLHGDSHLGIEYVCDSCNPPKTFKNKKSYERHVKFHTGESEYHCCKEPNCGMQFETKNNLKRHMNVHMGPTLPCRVVHGCKRLFSNDGERVQHEDYGHITEKDFQCIDCKKNYKTPKTLKMHKCKKETAGRK